MCQVKIINDRLLRRYHYQVCQSAWDHARSNSWLYKCHFAVTIRTLTASWSYRKCQQMDYQFVKVAVHLALAGLQCCSHRIVCRQIAYVLVWLFRLVVLTDHHHLRFWEAEFTIKIKEIRLWLNAFLIQRLGEHSWLFRRILIQSSLNRSAKAVLITSRTGRKYSTRSWRLSCSFRSTWKDSLN